MGNDNKAVNKPFATPRQYAVCALLIAVGTFGLSGIILHTLKVDTHIAIILGGIVGVLLYRAKYPIDIKGMASSFDITVPIMIFLLNFTACELASGLFGAIFSRFMTVKENTHSTVTAAAVIGSVILAPIGEELTYRLCGQGLIGKCYGKMFTILFPTLVFSLMHGFYNIQGMVNVFAGTICFALCYYYTENVLYTIIAHMLHNLCCLPDASAFYNSVNGFDIPKLPAAAVCLVIFAAGVVWYVKVFRVKYGAARLQRTDAGEQTAGG